MTPDSYILSVISKYKSQIGLFSPAYKIRSSLYPIIKKWANQYLLDVSISGSFAKGTAIKGSTDVDLFISLSSRTPCTLEEIYESLFKYLISSGYNPVRQNVSIGLKYFLKTVQPTIFPPPPRPGFIGGPRVTTIQPGIIPLPSRLGILGGQRAPSLPPSVTHPAPVREYSVDLIPAKKQAEWSHAYSLFKNKSKTWIQTNIQTHINLIKASGRLNEIRALKIWRKNHNLEISSFYLELIVLEALHRKGRSQLAANVYTVLEYLRDDFVDARIVDPANSNNIISDDLTNVEKKSISYIAEQSINEPYWEQTIW